MEDKRLNEIIRKCVKNYINEAMDERFSFEELKSIPLFKERLKYCTEKLGFRIGAGTSRVCFQLDDNKILKLAINKKGVAQNIVEGQPDYMLDGLGIKPEIYDETDYDNYLWIVCEYVLPAKKSDFPKILGITWDKFDKFINTSASQISSERGKQELDWEEFSELIENNGQLNAINDFITNYDPPIGDLRRICNYGLSRENGIVILDTGLTDKVYDKYYNHQK